MIGSRVHAVSTDEHDGHMVITRRSWIEGEDRSHVDERVDSSISIIPMNDDLQLNRQVRFTITHSDTADTIVIPDSAAVRIAEFILSQRRPVPTPKGTSV